MNETPVGDNLVDEASFQSRDKMERSLSNRILGWAFGASIIVNIAWVALVSGSNLFGKGGALPVMHERPVKVFKPIPVKPKPKPVKPPPPPPRPPKVQPKITPIKPHPTPPQPQRHQVQVRTTTNTHTTSTLSAPPAPPSPPGPFVPTYTPTPPAPPAPPVPPTPLAPPAPPAVAPPAPKAPPPAPPPPPPPRPSPPPPPPRPRNYSPIETQQADFPDVSGDVNTDGIDTSSLAPGSKVVISFVISEIGRVRDARITGSCGNSELDNRFLSAVRRTRGTPAIQEHIPHEESRSETFPVGS